MGLSTTPRSIQCLLVSRRSSSRPSGTRLSGHCVSGSAGGAHGIDVDDHGNGTVTEPRLYQLLRQPPPIAERQFEIEFLDTGVEAFVLTFG